MASNSSNVQECGDDSLWTSRLETAGHTGWSNPVIYHYDQMERLRLIGDQLDQLYVDPKVAVDFGCGTGDFSKLLLDRGFQVWAYDPHVQPHIQGSDYHYLTDLDQFPTEAGLILSVTVLDHLVDDKIFHDALSRLRGMIAPSGRLLMIEYAVDNSATSQSSYQAFRTIDAWQRFLGDSGWMLDSIEPVPHPIEAPSAGFQAYRRQLAVRCCRPLYRVSTCRGVVNAVLRRAATAAFRRAGLGQVNQSPLKLMLCHPVS